MSKVTVVPWTDELFDAREAEFASLVLDGVGNMTDTALAALYKHDITTAAATPPPAGQQPPPQPPAIPPQVETAALASWGIYVQDMLSPQVDDVLQEGAALVVDGLLEIYGLTERDQIPPVSNFYADEYLQQAHNRMVGVGENVWKGIKRELLAGMEAGEGISELSARLEDYARLSDSRARTVARTEVISSANAGSYLQMVAAGIEGTTKEWLATDDHRTRTSHEHADDQAVPLLGEFQVEMYSAGELTGTEPMEFPGDPVATPANVINCRCSMGFSFDDDEPLDASVLTAAKVFVEAEHPRDAKGKFMNKLEIGLLKAKDKDAFLSKLTSAEKEKIGKPTKAKAGVIKDTPQNKDVRAKKGRKLKSKGEKWRKVTPEEYAEARVKLIMAESKRHDEHFDLPTNEKFNENTARKIVGHELAKAGEIYQSGDSFLTVDKDAESVTPEAVQRALTELDELDSMYPDTGSVNVRIASSKSNAAGSSHSGMDPAGGRVITISEPRASLEPPMFPKPFMPAAVDTPDVDYTITHEYGHARGYIGGRSVDFWQQHKAGLSPYGRENADEGYAEAFAEWHVSEGRTDNAAARAYAEEYGWHTFSDDTNVPLVLGGKDRKTGKQAPAGKPVFLRVKTLFETDYEDGAIVAVRPESDERVVWDGKAKRMLLQKDGKTTDTLTRGALMKLRKDEEGWFTPSEENTAPKPAPEAPTAGPASEITQQDAPAVDISDISLTKNQLNTLAGFGKIEAAHAGTTAPVKGMYTSAYMPLDRAGLIEPFIQDHPRAPGQAAQWYRITDKGRAVLAAGQDVVPIPPKAKARKLYVEYNGVVHTRTTSNDYKYASVVHVGGKDIVYSWHKTEALAAKSTLTGMQRQNGAHVVAVLEVSDKPLTPSVVPTANVPDAPQENVPVPADIPTVRTGTPDGSIPDPDVLSSTGKVVGSHGATIYRDTSTGREWLFKPSPPGMGTFMADVDVATARLREVIGLPTPTTGLIKLDGKTGSIQQMFEGATDPFGYNFKPQDLTPEDKLVIQKEQIFDWLISNHDGHSRNFVRLPSGELVGVDKGQAFKFFGSDDLDPSFNPNPTETAANLLMQAYAAGEGGGALIFGVDHPEIKKLFKKIDDIGFTEYEKILLPYATNAAKYQMLAKGGPKYLGLTDPVFPPNDVDKFMEFAWDRKETLKEDFQVLFADLAKKRKSRLAALHGPETPAVMVQEAASSGEALHLDSSVLEKTKYSHGQIVAISKAGFDRVIWNGDNKKYDHQLKSGSGDWFTAESLSKSAAVKYFGEYFAVWTKPQDGKTHADIPVPLPHVAGTPKPKTPRKVAVPFTLEQLDAQKSTVPIGFSNRDKLRIFNSFKSDGVETLDRLASGYEMFLRLLEVHQDERRHGNDMSLAQLISIIDDSDARMNGAPREPWSASSIRRWLDTPDGEVEAGRLIHLADLGGLKAPLPDTLTVGQVRDIKVSKPGTGGTGAFPDMNAAEAEKFFDAVTSDLPIASANSIRRYSASEYTEINSAMRQISSPLGHEASQKDFIQAGHIQNAMRPLPQNMTLYRGAEVDSLGFRKMSDVTAMDIQALEGQTFTDHGFVSTSISKDEGYSSRLRFQIEAPKGSPALYLGPISSNPAELEMLLAAGTKFKIIKVVPANGNKLDTRAAITIVVRIVP